jgi:aspartate-semialdehyde dehydrogenase
MHRHVPLLIPEVNADHLALAADQDFGTGAILTNPNCSTIGLALALAPLHQTYEVDRVHVVTLQALSGAGMPGVQAMSALDNVIPYIPGEVDKLREETPKILGSMNDGVLVNAHINVSAQCNRVPVSDGHTLCVSVGLRRPALPYEVEATLAVFRGPDDVAALPSAPRLPIHVLNAVDAPQPRLHRDLEHGMALAVGQVRPCPLLSVSFVCLSHNTLRGAAGGSMLVAELAVSRGLVSGSG